MRPFKYELHSVDVLHVKVEVKNPNLFERDCQFYTENDNHHPSLKDGITIERDRLEDALGNNESGDDVLQDSTQRVFRNARKHYKADEYFFHS